MNGKNLEREYITAKGGGGGVIAMDWIESIKPENTGTKTWPLLTAKHCIVSEQLI